MDGIELRHTAPVLPGTWGLLDAFYAEHRDRLGAALGAGDSHFGEHDLGRVLTVFPGNGGGGPASRDRGTDHVAHVRRGLPSGPPLRMRLAQQYRSMVWLGGERRAGRVGGGAGPSGGAVTPG